MVQKRGQGQDSALRLVTGVLIEIHEEWITGNRWLDMGISEEKELRFVEEEAQAV